MPIHLQLSPLLRRLWDNVWGRLPEQDKAYLNTLPLSVEQFTERQIHFGRILWRENDLVVTFQAQMPDGALGYYIIAHELAHVVLHHHYFLYMPFFKGWSETMELQAFQARELLADTLVFHWGFGQEIIASIKAGMIRNPALTQWLLNFKGEI